MRRTTSGWWNGLAGVVIFSGSLPATRLALADLDPVFLTVARAAIAGVLAACTLVSGRVQRPAKADLWPLAAVSCCVVLGFPLLTALALTHVSSAHGMVFIGGLPLATAVFGVLRGAERPRAAFWLFSGLGGALVASFALAKGLTPSLAGDALMLAGIVLCGFGYAEGARLSRHLGGLPVICWALVLALPWMLLLVLLDWPRDVARVTAASWLGLAYVSVFSMLVGFVFWYRGLAQGGIAAVGQLQLLQPFLGMALAAILLHEDVTPAMLAVALAVIACVVGARRFAAAPAQPSLLLARTEIAR